MEAALMENVLNRLGRIEDVLRTLTTNEALSVSAFERLEQEFEELEDEVEKRIITVHQKIDTCNAQLSKCNGAHETEALTFRKDLEYFSGHQSQEYENVATLATQFAGDLIKEREYRVVEMAALKEEITAANYLLSERISRIETLVTEQLQWQRAITKKIKSLPSWTIAFLILSVAGAVILPAAVWILKFFR